MSYARPKQDYSPLTGRVCPTCNGTGINPQMPSRVCPKCDGEKRVPLKGCYQ